MIDAMFYIMLFLMLFIGLMYFLMPYLIPKNLQFGVRIPPEYYNEKIIGTYRKLYWTDTLIITVLMMILLYSSSSSIFILFIYLLLLFINYYLFHRLLLNIKLKNNWYANVNEGTVAKIEKKPQKIKFNMFLWSIPNIILILISIFILILVYPSLPAIIPIHFNASGVANGWTTKSPLHLSTLIFVMVGLTILFYILSFMIFRSREELDPQKPKLSSMQEHKFKDVMAEMIMVMGWCVNITMLLGNLEIWKILGTSPYSILIIISPVFVGLVMILIVSIYAGSHGSRLKFNVSEKETNIVMRDDDKYWIAGSLYFNRDDKSFVVQKRFGIGWTFNFANIFVWVIFAGIAVAALIPILLVIFK
ncbi:MAG: DUF1648 domain-containing protein [Thermoplasmata archaeon]